MFQIFQNVFEKSILCSPRQYLFNQKYSETNNVRYF